MIFPSANLCLFGTLASDVHLLWVDVYGSTMRRDYSYTISDVGMTYPHPHCTESLKAVAGHYWSQVSEVSARYPGGLTDVLNALHESSGDPAIARLRLQRALLNSTVIEAYGWTDLDVEHDFFQTNRGTRYTLSSDTRRVMLDRLLQLNHERYAEEIAQGLHAKKRGSRAKAAAQDEGALFDVE